MKKIIFTLFLGFGLCSANFKASAQVEELEQLVLDLEKLGQFKQILTDLKKAYDILFGGYTLIKNISEGNFNLHKTFLDGLLAVSPAVQKYKKIADIASLQLQLVKEYKSAFNRFKNNQWFSSDEIDYIGTVYSKLFNGSLADLDALLNVITAGKMRMSDDERIKEIDRVFESMQSKVVFLRHFNSSTAILAIQRSKEKNDIDIMRKLYDLNN